MSTKDDKAINIPSTNKNKGIKEVGSDSNKVGDVGIVDANRMAKSKGLTKAEAGFFIPRAR